MMKRITFMIMMLLVIAGTSYSQDKQDWKWMHPTPQSNILRKIKMVSGTDWVTAGANGTFMHTTNSGSNWYFHHFAGKVTAGTLATTQNYDMWFFDSNTGIVVGDQGYIGRTVNGGVTFDEVGVGLIAANSRCQSIWFANANTGYIGAGSQNAFTTIILKTTNAGLNWSTVYSDLSGSTSYLTTLGGIDDQNVFASWANGSLLSTSNGGTNWTITPTTFPTIMYNMSFLNSTTGFCSGGLGTVSRTTNAGLNWSPVNTPTVDWSMFQVKVVSETEIYAIGDASSLYKSTDLGTTWQTLPISVNGPSVTFVWYSLDKNGSTYVLSGDYGIVAISNDGCATWSTNNYTQYSNALMYDITTVPGTSKYWVIGRPFPVGSTNRELLYSSNSGATWTPYNLGYTGDFFSISMINENTGYVSGQNNRVLKTTDGGASWTPKTGPSPVATSQLYTCEFIDENTGWVFVNLSTVAGGNVFKTTNGGDNWTQYTTGAASENIYSADMVNANTGFCVMNTSNRPIYRTTNGGVNWTGATTTGFTGSIRGVSSPDGITVYACQTGGTSRVAKSTNGGVNWTLITMPVTTDFNSIDFKDANTGYVSGGSSGAPAICKTTDGGVTWTTQNTHGITNIKVYVTQGDTAWALGGNTAIFRYAGPTNQIKINLSIAMEGMYSSVTNQLAMRDTVKVYLRNSTSPYAVKDSAKAVIDSLTQTALFTFSNAPSGTYYIVANHRNCIETWSRIGGETFIADGSTYNYSFVSGSSQAYGSNMTLKGSKWCIYSGDPNKDNTVDASDLSLVDNDVNFSTSGYVATDLTGDNFVDTDDLSIVDNNSYNAVGIIRP